MGGLSDAPQYPSTRATIGVLLLLLLLSVVDAEGVDVSCSLLLMGSVQ